MRHRTDRLYPPPALSPRFEQASSLVAEQPGISIAKLAATLGVGIKRAWQLIGRLRHDCWIHRIPTDREA